VKRETIPASPEHEAEFRATFELRPEFRDDVVAQLAFEHAAKYKLYGDEMSYVGAVIQRNPDDAEGGKQEQDDR